jgi:hypothetical protein
MVSPSLMLLYIFVRSVGKLGDFGLLGVWF